MNQLSNSELNESLSVFDDYIELNKKELNLLFDKLEGKPIGRKLHLVSGGLQSSISKLKELTIELIVLNCEMDIKIFQMALNSKQITERVEHHPKYNKYHADHQVLKKKFSMDVEIWKNSLDEFMPQLESINFLLDPLEYDAKENAVFKVDQFNRVLNQKVHDLRHLFEDMKQKYQHLLQYQKQLEELMILCGIQQTK